MRCNASGVTQRSLPLLPGHWRQHDLALSVRDCGGFSSACLGGSNTSAQCAANHTGPYCSQCVAGHYANSGSCKSCEDTFAALVPIIIVLGVLLFLLLLCQLGVWARRRRLQEEEEDEAAAAEAGDAPIAPPAALRRGKATRSLFDERQLRRKLESLSSKVRRLMDWGSVKARILVSLFQVLNNIGPVFSIPYPDAVRDVLAAIAAIEFNWLDLGSVSCALPWLRPFYFGLVVRTAGPLLALLAFYLLHLSLHRRHPTVTASLDNLAFMLTYLLYPGTSAKICSAFVCDSIGQADGSTKRFLVADLSIHCDSNSHRLMQSYALVMAIISPVGPLGGPFVFGLIIWRSREALRRLRAEEAYAYCIAKVVQLQRKYGRTLHADPRSSVRVEAVRRLSLAAGAETLAEVGAETAARRSTSSRKSTWGGVDEARERELNSSVRTVTEPYRMACAPFELFECARKLALIGLPAFLPVGSDAQLIFGYMTCFLSFGVYMKYKPYRERSDNIVACVAQSQIFFTLLAALILKQARITGEHYPTLDKFLVASLLVSPIVAFVPVKYLTRKKRELKQWLRKRRRGGGGAAGKLGAREEPRPKSPSPRSAAGLAAPEPPPRKRSVAALAIDRARARLAPPRAGSVPNSKGMQLPPPRPCVPPRPGAGARAPITGLGGGAGPSGEGPALPEDPALPAARQMPAAGGCTASGACFSSSAAQAWRDGKMKKGGSGANIPFRPRCDSVRL